jgi:ABC-type glutathione transport system ATPase component
MLQGRIVEQGRKNEILTPPHHEYMDLLLSSVPEMDPDWLDNLLAERQPAKGPTANPVFPSNQHAAITVGIGPPVMIYASAGGSPLPACCSGAGRASKHCRVRRRSVRRGRGRP